MDVSVVVWVVCTAAAGVPAVMMPRGLPVRPLGTTSACLPRLLALRGGCFSLGLLRVAEIVLLSCTVYPWTRGDDVRFGAPGLVLDPLRESGCGLVLTIAGLFGLASFAGSFPSVFALGTGSSLWVGSRRLPWPSGGYSSWGDARNSCWLLGAGVDDFPSLELVSEVAEPLDD